MRATVMTALIAVLVLVPALCRPRLLVCGASLPAPAPGTGYKHSTDTPARSGSSAPAHAEPPAAVATSSHTRVTPRLPPVKRRWDGGGGWLAGGAEAAAASTRLSFLNLAHLYLPDATNASRECGRDVMAIYQAMANLEALVQNGTLWPLKLVDSWGKFSDGVLELNVNLMGFFYECLELRVVDPPGSSALHRAPDHPPAVLAGLHVHQSPGDPPDPLKADFAGQYCYIKYREAGQGLWARSSRVPGISAALPWAANFLSYATCMPSTCTARELQNTVDAALAPWGLEVAMNHCQTSQSRQRSPFTSQETTGIVVVSVLAALLGLATLADLLTRSQSTTRHRQGRLKYLLVFSVPHNMAKIFHVDTTKSANTIYCLHGMRFLSITWVVMGHQYIYSVTNAENLAELPPQSTPVLFQVIANADKSVDTFLFMSGLLVTVGVLSQVSLTGRFNAPLYYLHRLARLMPAMALVVTLLATLSGLMVSGPWSPAFETYYLPGCRRSWWMDVFFVSNLVLPHIGQMAHKDEEFPDCVPHSWYLGVDMQIYLIMPLLVLPLYFWPRRGRAWLGLWTLTSLLVPAAIIGAYHLWPTSLIVLDQEAMLEFNYKVYMMPWCRAGPYLVGAWAGYLLHQARKHASRPTLSTWQVALGWLTAAAVALAVLLGIARYNVVGTPDSVPQMSLAEAVLYGGLHRAAWGAALAWVVLACHWGYGGPVNWFLAHPCWQPLSRLTYTIYLTSLPIQIIIIYSVKRPQYYTHFLKLQETWGYLVVIILSSLAVSLASEAPVINLEKLILRRSGPRAPTQAGTEESGAEPDEERAADPKQDAGRLASQEITATAT